MGKSKAPAAPDPVATAKASTSTNVGTAIANAMMGNVNQVTPTGALTYSQNGTYDWADPYTGQTYKIPTFTATQTLSPEQQAIQNQTSATDLNLATIANDRSNYLKDYFSTSVDTSGAPSLVGSPNLATSIGNGYNAQFSGDLGNGYAKGVGLATSYAGADDFSADRQKVEDALWQRGATTRAANEEALRTRLLNSGIREGSAAWNAEMQRLSSQVTDERLATVAAAGQEQSRLVGLAQNAAQFGNDATLNQASFGNQAALQAAQFGSGQQQAQNAAAAAQAQFGNEAALNQANFQNQARAQGLQEAYTARNQPLNEILALQSGAQVQNPNFVNTNMPTIATTDVAGLINQNYQSQLAAWQQQQANSSALLGNLISGGSYLGASFIKSDDDVKKDKKRLGDIEGPMGLWEFRYKGEPKGAPKRIGLMASEVERIRPEAVVRDRDGTRSVNYAQALGLMGM